MIRKGFICSECSYSCSNSYCLIKEEHITGYLELCSDFEEDI